MGAGTFRRPFGLLAEFEADYFFGVAPGLAETGRNT